MRGSRPTSIDGFYFGGWWELAVVSAVSGRWNIIPFTLKTNFGVAKGLLRISAQIIEEQCN
jgi:hypothetical protein